MNPRMTDRVTRDYDPIMWTTLHGRLRWVLDEQARKGISARQVSREALGNPDYLNARMATLRKNPNGRIGADILAAIARVTHVDQTWLATGVGNPHTTDQVEQTYPGRDLVIHQLAPFFPAEVLDELRRTAPPQAGVDPGAIWWSRQAHWLLSVYDARGGPFSQR